MSMPIGPTPNNQKIKADFQSFLTNLREKSPNLSREEILEKMISWVDSQSDDQKTQAMIVRQINLIVHTDKINNDSGDKNKGYLTSRSSNDPGFYFKGLKIAFQRMEATNPKGLESLYGLLYRDWSNEKVNGTHMHSPETLFQNIKIIINSGGNTPEEKKLLARQIARHLALSSEDMFTLGTKGYVLEEAEVEEEVDKLIEIPEQGKNMAAVSFFKQKVSPKDYNIYFKNLEKEAVPPEEFFAELRFNYRNDIAFAGRVLRYDFGGILKGGIIVALVFAALFFAVTASEIGLVAAVAVLVAKAAGIATSLAILAVLSLPLVAGGLYSGYPLNGYVFPIKILLLTPLVAISSVFSLLFSSKPDVPPSGGVDDQSRWNLSQSLNLNLRNGRVSRQPLSTVAEELGDNASQTRFVQEQDGSSSSSTIQEKSKDEENKSASSLPRPGGGSSDADGVN